MLQTNKTPTLVDRGFGPQELSPPSELFHSFVSFVRRQFPVILFVVLLILAVGVVFLFTTPPRFTGHAVMIIDSHRVQLFQQPSILTDNAADFSMVESQVEVLKSENIALSVIKELHLFEDPEFVGSGGGLISTLFEFVSSLFLSVEPTSEYRLMRDALLTFESRLTVKRVGLTYAIDIKFQSLNPERAAQIANAIADAYVVDQLEAKYQATKRAGQWMQDRIRELREQTSTADRAVVNFKAKNNIVDAGGRLMNEQQLAESSSQLMIARAQTSETRARLDRIESVLRADSPNATVDATVADSLKNEVITKLRSQYLELANREADWSARYGHNHLAAIHLRNQMREIRTSIVDELRRIAETYKSDYEIAKQREDAIERGLNEVVSQSQVTSQAQIILRELESTSQTYRALHDNFLQRYMESVQQQSFPITEARLITQASRPLKKSYPNTLITLAITIMGGIILGLGAGMVRDLWDRVFRTSDQVESILQTNCLAVLPLLKGSGAKGTSSGRKMDGGPRSIVRGQGLLWEVIDSPLSRFTESIRSIKVAVDLYGTAKSNKVIGFTSALPSEGKSTTAAALAQLMAHAGAQTILVDCDLRNPELTRSLTPTAAAGVLELISGKMPIQDLVWTDRSTKLAFLPAVVKSRFAHTSEVLGGDAIKKLFEQLRERYDYVIVDLSPLAPVVDVRATAHFVDSYVFLIEWGRTKSDMVKHTLNEARSVYENLLGAVLNKADVNVLARYEGYRSGKYYSKYYARYGYTE